MKSTVKIFAAVMLLGLLFSACGDNLTNPTSSETARVKFNIVVANTTKATSRATVNIGTLVTSGAIRLSRGSMVKYVTLTISNGYAYAAVSDLLVGNWHADVQLYDTDGLILYSGSADFTIYNASTTQNIELVLARHEGTALFSFELPTETTEGPIFWNKLESETGITNSTCGPGLIPGTGTLFAAGKWGNGIDCGSSVKTASPRIPAGTIPAGDFSITFWYTKTSDFTEGDIAALLHTRDSSGSFTNNMSLVIGTPWKPSSGGTFYCIQFAVKLGTYTGNQVVLYYDLGSLEAVNNAFPLNTPVHIAITKRNSDGKLCIFLNGSQVPAVYADFDAYTTDTSFIANQSGYFPFETFIGNYSDVISDDNPAKGVIDNIKIFDQAISSFYIGFE